MIQDDAAQAWDAATAVVRAIAPHATETAQALDRREQAYVNYVDSVTRIHEAVLPLSIQQQGTGHTPGHEETRAAAEATVAAAREARSALDAYTAEHLAYGAARDRLDQALEGGLLPALAKQPWTAEKQVEAFTRLAYQYMQADRPNDAATRTTADYLDLGDELTNVRNELAREERAELDHWLNGDRQGDEPEIHTAEWLAEDALLHFADAYPPENEARPTVISKYFEATSLARIIEARKLGFGYPLHSSPDTNVRHLEAVTKDAQAIVARPQDLNPETSEHLRRNVLKLAGAGRNEDLRGYNAWDHAEELSDTVKDARRLHAMSFPQPLAKTLQQTGTTPTADYQRLSAARATRTAAWNTAVQRAADQRLNENDLPF